MERKHDDLLAERRVSNDFRWASRCWAGSKYFVRGKAKEPKELIQSVLASKKVKDVIQELAKKNGESEAKIQKEAHAILVEMAHDFHMYAIRWFGLILSKLGKRLYNSIQVNTEKIPKIREAYQSYPVIVLPTHRSYVDFLLISYLSFHYDLPLPIIAAGMDFMSMTGVGELLRKSGAFFIRRRFGGDVLYWALISEYVKIATMEGGHPFEMFIEGTRSRSGKSIKPKIGLLSSALELVASCEVPDILILPISMSYDRTLEETLYAHELLGKPKPKESTNGLMKALRWLGNQNYGSIYVNFGNLISVRRELEKLCSLPTSVSPQNTILNQAIHNLALKVILENQQQSVVPIFSVIATVALAKLSRGVNIVRFDELMEHMNSLEQILASSDHTFGYPLQRESLETNVRFIISVHSNIVTLQSGNSLVLVFAAQPENSVQHMTLQHYSNQVLPFLVPLSLLLILTKTNTRCVPSLAETLMDKKLEVDYCFLRHLLEEDFMYESGTEVSELCSSLEYVDSLSKAKSNSAAKYRDALNILDVLRRALEPYILAYWGVTMTLQNISPQSVISIKELSTLTQEVLHDLIKTNKCVRQYGGLALETLSNSINSFVHLDVLSRVKLENSTFGVKILDEARLKEIRDFLGTLASGFKWNVVEAGADANGNPTFNEEKAGQDLNLKQRLN